MPDFLSERFRKIIFYGIEAVLFILHKVDDRDSTFGKKGVIFGNVRDGDGLLIADEQNVVLAVDIAAAYAVQTDLTVLSLRGSSYNDLSASADRFVQLVGKVDGGSTGGVYLFGVVFFNDLDIVILLPFQRIP